MFRVNVTADYNMDLVIALEMSRLQMIEDEMKKRQREDVAETSVSVPVAKGDSAFLTSWRDTEAGHVKKPSIIIENTNTIFL